MLHAICYLLSVCGDPHAQDDDGISCSIKGSPSSVVQPDVWLHGPVPLGTVSDDKPRRGSIASASNVMAGLTTQVSCLAISALRLPKPSCVH